MMRIYNPRRRKIRLIADMQTGCSRRVMGRIKKPLRMLTALTAALFVTYFIYDVTSYLRMMNEHVAALKRTPIKNSAEWTAEWLALERALAQMEMGELPNKTYAGPYIRGGPDSSSCHIPDMSPRHPSILPYLKPAPAVRCNSPVTPITYTTGDLERGRQAVVIDRSEVRKLGGGLTCCYSVVTRVMEDMIEKSLCIDFDDSAVLGLDVDFILVFCRDTSTHQQVYANVHAVVQVKPTPRRMQHDTDYKKTSPALTPLRPQPKVLPYDNGDKKYTVTSSPMHATGVDEKVTPAPLHRLKPNVLLLGIDSMSRQNLLRTLPRTVAYMRRNSWLPLRMYNKIGDNTLPNLMALLTGLQEDQLRDKKCWNHVPFDHCPFIWKRFKERGYVTAYAEDEIRLSTFNCNDAGGFTDSPTDYYMRPFLVAASRHVFRIIKQGLTLCIGPTAVTDIFLRYTRDLLSTFRHSLFALVWLNNFSHSDHNLPAAMDDRIVDFLLDTEDLRNDTIVVFLSDHGTRFGGIRNTYAGWLEERLPFLYVSLPGWFRESYPEAYSNLRDNRDKLTSPFDVHLLLRDVAEGRVDKGGEVERRKWVVAGEVGDKGGMGDVGGIVNKGGIEDNLKDGEDDRGGCEGCPTCVSLFKAVSGNRSCDEAGIPSYWCACADLEETAITAQVVQNASQHAVHVIREQLAAFNRCAVLQLKRVLSARLKVIGEERQPFREYVIVFETTPGDAVFDATVRYWRREETSPYKIRSGSHGSNVTSLFGHRRPGLVDDDARNLSKNVMSVSEILTGFAFKARNGSNMASPYEDKRPGMAGAGDWLEMTSRYEVHGMISRITAYEGESECVQEKKLKLYCYCLPPSAK